MLFICNKKQLLCFVSVTALFLGNTNTQAMHPNTHHSSAQTDILTPDPDTINTEETHPLIAAAKEGNVKKLSELLESAPQDAYIIQKAFVWAAGAGKVAALEFLATQGAQINAVDKDNYTPLVWASREGKLNAAQWLVKHGALVNPENPEIRSPLGLAAGNGQKNVVSFLLKKDARVDILDKGLTPLHSAVIAGDIDSTYAILQHAQNKDVLSDLINKQDAKQGRTPIHCTLRYREGAPKKDRVQFSPETAQMLMKILIAAGANPKATAFDKSTPSYWAEKNHWFKEAELLEVWPHICESCKYIDAATKNGDTKKAQRAYDAMISHLRTWANNHSIPGNSTTDTNWRSEKQPEQERAECLVRDWQDQATEAFELDKKNILL